MAIWGKIIGGVAGLSLGGPLGGMLGGVAGHAFDKMRDGGFDFERLGLDDLFGDRAGAARDQFSPQDREAMETIAKRQIAFTTAIVVLSAKMAKADGVVTRDEIAVFKTLFKIPEDEVAAVGALFNSAKRDASGFEPYAEQIAQMFVGSPNMLEEILSILFAIALADGTVHPAELNYLGKVASLFGFTPAEFERIRAAHMGPESEDPYVVLGVSKSDGDDAIKSAYRKLIRENHPDVLIAKGMPEDFIDMANQKMARINAAYDEIAKARGLV